MKHCVLVNFTADCYKNGSCTQIFVMLNKCVAVNSNSLIPFYLLPITHLLNIYCIGVKRVLK